MSERWTKDEMLAFEKDLLGFYVTGHPLDGYRNTILSEAKVRSYLELEELPTGKDKKYEFIAFVSSAAVKYTKSKGLPFAILMTEDLQASGEVLVWNDVYEKTDRSLLAVGSVIRIQASIDVDARTETRRLVASAIRPCWIDPKAKPLKKKLERFRGVLPGGLEGAPNGEGAMLNLYLISGRTTDDELCSIRDLLVANRGDTPVRLTIRTSCGDVQVLRAGDAFKVARSPELEDALARWM